MSIARLYPKAPREDLTATITAAGERVTGIPEGTVLPWPSWRRLPQTWPGNPPIATWELPGPSYLANLRHGHQASPGEG